MNQKSGNLLLSLTVVISLMAGTYILLMDWNFSGMFGYIVTFGLLLGAVMYAGSPHRSWAAVISMIAGAIYVFYRTTGHISFPLLRYVLGLSMISYGVFGLFTLFRSLNKQKDERG